MNAVIALFLFSTFSVIRPPVEGLSLGQCIFIIAKDVCPNKNILYWLYNSKVSAYKLNINDHSVIRNAPFVPNVTTVFLLNGYNGTRDDYINELRPQFLKKGYNVITAEYFNLVPIPCYIQAVGNADLIARCFVDFFKILLNFEKFSISQVHVLGFSLGAQIAGRAGKYLIKDGIKLPRITGLDAAAPLFYGPSSYIDKYSAAFVDTIHTNSLVFGKMLPIGHVDFYCNDIVYQPQCASLILGDLILCSHVFSYKYYSESMLPTHYFCGKELIGLKRERMGEYVSLSARGVYTVKTNRAYPYAKDTAC